MAEILSSIFSNLWVSGFSFLIWVGSIIFMIKIDIGLLRGRGDFKSKEGKFEKWGITATKGFIVVFVIILSFIFSLSFLANIGKYSSILFIILIMMMLIVSTIIIIPTKLLRKGRRNDFGVRWLIDLIDKHDRKKAVKN